MTPANLLRTRFGYIAARAIGVAVELDLFTRMAEGKASLHELCQATRSSERGLRALLKALVPLDLVREDRPGHFQTSPESERYLVSHSPHYLGGMIRQADRLWERWGRLGEAVRSGLPPEAGIESNEDDGRFFSEFVQGLYNLNAPAARELARELARFEPARVLDVGAGSAVWSLALVAERPATLVTALDRERVLEQVTRAYVREHGAENYYSYLAGDLRESELEPEGYDLVILGHVLHSEGREGSRRLLARAFRALRPGGALAVAEVVPDAEQSDVYSWLFGLHMLLLTTEGDVFEASELEALVGEAGFGALRWPELPGPYAVLLARR